MLALRCPHCQAVAPIPVSTRGTLQCDSCGQRSELPDDARRQLEVAERLLKSTDPGKRKLSRAQAEALVSAKRGRKVLWVLHGVFVFLALSWAAVGVAMMVEEGRTWDEQLLFGTMCLSPLAIVVSAAWRGGAKLTARRQALAEKCAASPPVAPGAPVRCRVCAASILAGSTEKVATCEYCGADNLLGKEVLARAVHRTKALTADLTAEVRSAMEDVSDAAWSAYFQAIKSAFLAPIFSFGAMFIVALGAFGTFREVDLKAEYAIVQEEGRPCIARIVEGTTLEMRRGKEAMDLVRRAIESSATLERSRATRFLGGKLRDVSGKEWTVQQVKRRLGGRNVVLFVEDEAPPATELEAFCLSEAR
jgi:hypothetical protein